jgi:hypothetical protein
MNLSPPVLQVNVGQELLPSLLHTARCFKIKGLDNVQTPPGLLDLNVRILVYIVITSVADPGCLFRIPEPILDPEYNKNKKRRGGNLSFFVATNFAKLKFFLFLNRKVPVQKRFRAN